jgi:hypothetical protein
MAGLVPAIHVLTATCEHKDVDARHKAGHDEFKVSDGAAKRPRQNRGLFSSSAIKNQRE